MTFAARPPRRRRGPHDYWANDRPPSRGQLATIAELSLVLMGEQPPTTRLEASRFIERLETALADKAHERPTSIPF